MSKKTIISCIGNYILIILVVSRVIETKAYRMLYQKNKTTNKEFVVYKSEFSRIINKKIKVNIEFNKLTSPVVGKCYPRNIIGKNIIPEIDIDPIYWKSATIKQKYLLLYHELLHCVCNQYRHIEGQKQFGCPKSIMSEKMASKKCIQAYYYDYLKEVKGLCRDI